MAWHDFRDSAEWEDACKPAFEVQTCCTSVLTTLAATSAGSVEEDAPKVLPGVSNLRQALRWAQMAREVASPTRSRARSEEPEVSALESCQEIRRHINHTLDLSPAVVLEPSQMLGGTSRQSCDSAALATPIVKRSRRTSQCCCASDQPPSADNRAEIVASDFHATDQVVASAALAALQSYRAFSATSIEEYRAGRMDRTILAASPSQSSSKPFARPISSGLLVPPEAAHVGESCCGSMLISGCNVSASNVDAHASDDFACNDFLQQAGEGVEINNWRPLSHCSNYSDRHADTDSILISPAERKDRKRSSCGSLPLATPHVKRSRRTSLCWPPSHGEDPTSVEHSSSASASSVDASIALAALQGYLQTSASVLQEYRASMDEESAVAPLPSWQDVQPGEVLSDTSATALVEAASQAVSEVCRARSDAGSARVLVMVPRVRLLLWYAATTAWARELGISVRALSGGDARSPARLCEEVADPGVCLVVDALGPGGLLEIPSSIPSVVVSPSVSLSGSRLSESSLAGASTVRGRRTTASRKMRRWSHKADDDDSENEVVSRPAPARISLQGTALPVAPVAWDLLVADISGGTAESMAFAAPQQVKHAMSRTLADKAPAKWLILSECAATGPPLPSMVRTPVVTPSPVLAPQDIARLSSAKQSRFIQAGSEKENAPPEA